MDERIVLRLDDEQADLIVAALSEFRTSYYERASREGDADTRIFRRNLFVIDNLKEHLKLELKNIYNR